MENTVKNNLPEALNGQKHTLRFRKNGEFRTLVFTDVQAQPPAPCERTVRAMNAVIDREDPDLVLFCGDNSDRCETEEHLREYLKVLTAHLEEKQIPWAHVYGNHDTERIGLDLTRPEEQAIYESFPYCVSKAGPENIKGTGNYVLPVYPAEESRTDPVFPV